MATSQDNLSEIIEYPNLPEHIYLIDDIQNIMSKKVGDMFNVSDYTCKLVSFIEDVRPIYIDNNIINIMWREDFTVHYYWVVILLMIYKIKYCQDEIEKISYQKLLKRFKHYNYTYLYTFVWDINFQSIVNNDYLNKISFIDILFILALYNIDRLEPDDIKTLVEKVYRDKHHKKSFFKDADKRLELQRDRLRQNLSKFYFRTI